MLSPRQLALETDGQHVLCTAGARLRAPCARLKGRASRTLGSAARARDQVVPPFRHVVIAVRHGVELRADAVWVACTRRWTSGSGVGVSLARAIAVSRAISLARAATVAASTAARLASAKAVLATTADAVAFGGRARTVSSTCCWIASSVAVAGGTAGDGGAGRLQMPQSNSSKTRIPMHPAPSPCIAAECLAWAQATGKILAAQPEGVAARRRGHRRAFATNAGRWPSTNSSAPPSTMCSRCQSHLSMAEGDARHASGVSQVRI